MENPSRAEDQVEQLYRDYRERLLGYLYRLVGDATAAEDLCQETFVKVLLHKATLDGLEHNAAWLYRIATNCAYDHLRRKRRRCIISLDGPAAGDHWASLRADNPATEPGSASLDEAIDLCSAINRLPPQKRAVVLLYYYAGYSQRDIATMTMTESGTVRSRLARARDKIRIMYAH